MIYRVYLRAHPLSPPTLLFHCSYTNCTYVKTRLKSNLPFSRWKMRDESTALLNGCQTCRCDLDYTSEEEAVINSAIMPWQLY